MATSSERRGAPLGPILAAAGLLGIVLLSGCGPPRVAPENLRLVEALATATSAREPEWLEQCAAEIEARRADGTLSDAEHPAFASILADARSGRWEDARHAAYALRDAQRPTTDTREAVRRRTLPEPRIPGKKDEG